jgi:VWFA-related protein
LLTDGQDSASRISRTTAIEQAVQTETVIYAIGIGDKKFSGVNRGALREIAERTGGRAFFPKKEDDLRSAFAEIEQELRSQYLIAYIPTNKKHDGSIRAMNIEITNLEIPKTSLQLRYRPGILRRAVTAALSIRGGSVQFNILSTRTEKSAEFFNVFRQPGMKWEGE